MTEKNILAFFNSPEQAEKVKDQLAGLDIVDMSIDRFTRYGASVANDNDRDYGILKAADPSSSGMSDGGGGGPTGRDVLLTVIVNDQDEAEARRIVNEGGGIT